MLEECDVFALKYDRHPSSSAVKINSKLVEVVCRFDRRNDLTQQIELVFHCASGYIVGIISVGSALSDEQLSVSKVNASISCNVRCHREHCSVI